MKNYIALLAAMFAMVNCVANAGTNLVTNGDFTSGGFGWSFTAAPSGSVFSYLAGSPACADFGANQGLDDTISQTLSTVPGTLYSISFQLSVGTVHIGGNDNGNDFHATFGSNPFFSATNISQQAFTTYNFMVVADTASTALVFSGRNGPNDCKLTGVVVQTYEPVIMASLTAGTGSINLRWPTNAVGFNLMQTTNLVPSFWNLVTNEPTVINTNFSVTLPLTLTTGFFRLQK